MIVSEIRDLEKYINSTVKAKCEFTNRDVGSSEYPFIKILMVEEFEIFNKNIKTLITDLPLELRIIVAKGDEYEALEVLERLYQKINQYNPEKGNSLEGTGTSEYIEETKTFEISLLYNLKLLIQDT